MSPGDVAPPLGISPGASDVIPLGAGAGAGVPHVGTSPAKATLDRAHVNASVAINRFMV
jgi:hypothetical protein